MKWLDNASTLFSLMQELSVRDRRGAKIAPEEGFDQWVDLAFRIRQTNGTIFLIGNGASASMASHIAADVAKSASIRTEVFYDLSLITALGNDIGFDDIFTVPLQLKGSEGDLVIMISSSGESPNIIKAVDTADRLGATVITLSAMEAGNRLRTAGQLNFYLPARTYGQAETCHAALLHHWVDRLADETVLRP